MKQLVLQLQAHPTFAKVWHWVKLIAITGGAQVVVQATGLLSGILIIRLLPVEEYALYTLANTMLGTMTVLADGGISTGVMAEGGKVWRDKEKLGTVIATGLDLRRKFAIGSLLVSIPILVYLLQNHGASVLMTLLIIASLIPAFFAALSDSLLQVAPKLHQEIVPLQKNQMTVSIIRLLLSGLTLFVFPWTFVALLANGIPRVYGNIQLRSLSSNSLHKNAKKNKLIEGEILKIVYRILPISIYYSFYSQIPIWITSFFGDTKFVAQLGALGRISVILTLFSTLTGTLLIPRFSRFIADRDKLFVFFLKTKFFILVALSLVVCIFYAYSDEILYIIGDKYKNLNFELLLIIISSCVSFLAGVSYSLFASRGWMIKPLLAIVISVLSVIIGACFFDIQTLIGVISFAIFTSSIQYIVNTSYLLYKINKL